MTPGPGSGPHHEWDPDGAGFARPPVLTDGEVTLRPWSEADAGALAAAWHDSEIARRLPVPRDRSVAAARAWIAGWEQRRRRGLALDLAVVLGGAGLGAGRGPVVGEVGLARLDRRRRAALIGWWLAAGVRGRGVAARAVELVAGWALGPGGLDALVAEIDPGNRASLAVATRCSFQRVPRRPGAWVRLREPHRPEEDRAGG